ncbi:MAG: glucosaminidase domain-containing protein [Candidatus Berkelbacteria bacterium]
MKNYLLQINKTFISILIALVFVTIGSTNTAQAKSLINYNINFDKTQPFLLTFTSQKTEVKPGLSQEDMNKVNIDHDPEAIKAYMKQIAPEYGVDWKLVYAIGAYESGYYKSSLAQYNNNFFGRKATSTTWMKYNSAEEGIRDQFLYVKEHYIDRGLDTPAKMNHIYCEGNTWQYMVQSIMDKTTDPEVSNKV